MGAKCDSTVKCNSVNGAIERSAEEGRVRGERKVWERSVSCVHDNGSLERAKVAWTTKSAAVSRRGCVFLSSRCRKEPPPSNSKTTTATTPQEGETWREKKKRNKDSGSTRTETHQSFHSRRRYETVLTLYKESSSEGTYRISYLFFSFLPFHHLWPSVNRGKMENSHRVHQQRSRAAAITKPSETF